MEEDAQFAKKWLIDLKTGSHELEALILHGLRVDAAEIGLIRCNFVVPHHLSDKDGNWHVGAMSILVDDIAACTVLSFAGKTMASVDFNISCYSSAKIHEEVEIEAKVEGERGILVSVVVKITKRVNGEKIAVAKQWMSTIPPKGSTQKKITPNAQLPSNL